MRYPPGWSRMGPEHILADEEFFVLDGSLEMDGELHEADSYAFLPAGWTRNSMASKNGCVLIAFYNCDPFSSEIWVTATRRVRSCISRRGR